MFKTTMMGMCAVFATAIFFANSMFWMSTFPNNREEATRRLALERAVEFCAGARCNPEYFAEAFERYLNGEDMDITREPMSEPMKSTKKEKGI
jgi:hypothetical protein